MMCGRKIEDLEDLTICNEFEMRDSGLPQFPALRPGRSWTSSLLIKKTSIMDYKFTSQKQC